MTGMHEEGEPVERSLVRLSVGGVGSGLLLLCLWVWLILVCLLRFLDDFAMCAFVCVCF